MKVWSEAAAEVNCFQLLGILAKDRQVKRLDSKDTLGQAKFVMSLFGIAA